MNVQFSCPLCSAALELPEDSIGVFQCSICQKSFTIEKAALVEVPEDLRWKSDRATRKQTNFLMLHGIEFDEQITKGDASAIIEKLIAENHEPKFDDYVKVKTIEDAQAREDRLNTIGRLRNSLSAKLDQLASEELSRKEM